MVAITNQYQSSLRIERSIEIAAPIQVAFDALIEQLGPAACTPDETPMPMKLEAWPGGRWFRDLGNDNGHLWGHVQVIKPPTLIEIQGPMFMSYAVAGHAQFRLTQVAGGVDLFLRHRVLGLIEEEHRQGVTHGWDYFLQGVKQLSETNPVETR